MGEILLKLSVLTSCCCWTEGPPLWEVSHRLLITPLMIYLSTAILWVNFVCICGTCDRLNHVVERSSALLSHQVLLQSEGRETFSVDELMKWIERREGCHCLSIESHCSSHRLVNNKKWELKSVCSIDNISFQRFIYWEVLMSIPIESMSRRWGMVFHH